MNPRAAFLSPMRAVETFRPAHRTFGPSLLDTATHAYREARDACDHTAALAVAYAQLANANYVLPQHRRERRAAAFRLINAVRAERRQAWTRRDRAEVALFAAGGTASAVDAADAARRVDHSLVAFTGVRIEDDPDMRDWRATS